MKLWRVWFDDYNAMLVETETEHEARFLARLEVWTLRDEWLTVQRVEEVKEEVKA